MSEAVSLSATRRQFLIAREPFATGEGWRHRDLPDGWVLSHQAGLTVAEARAADGRQLLILGEAFCLDTPEAGGSGRYAVLDWPHIEGDRAGALLSIFHGEGPAGPVVSSNAGLVARALGRDPRAPDIIHAPRHHSAQSYIPAPGSRHAGVRCLFRDQRLDISAGRVSRRPVPVAPMASHEAAVETAAGELCRFAREIRARVPGTLFVQLTAGLDSRTVVAAFVAEGVAFETLTLRSAAKPAEDVTVAAAISRKIGIRHHVYGIESPPDPAAGEAYWLQTSGALNDWDLTDLFPGRIYRFLGPGDALIGGAAFEVGRQKFTEVLGGMTLETATGAAIYEGLGREPAPPEFAAFLEEWLDWRRAAPYPLNFTATHYLDQRLGAWAATALAGLDLLPGIVVHPANNPRIFDALVTPSLEDQAEGRLQRDVIAALAPELLDFPLNPVPLRRKLRRLISHTKRSVLAGLRPSRPAA